jgi:peptidoglycan DL-endopeptidase LytE
MKPADSFPLRMSLLSSIFIVFSFPAVLSAGSTHVVEPGESLYTIGRKYRVSSAEISAVNGLGGDLIRPGQRLRIPGGRAKMEKSSVQGGPRAAEGRAGASGMVQTHTVAKGDTLASIAHRYGIGVEALREINGLEGSKILPGQVFRLSPGEADESRRAAGEAEALAPEAREEARVLVQGNGLFTGEKSRELLGRVARSFLGFRYAKGGGSINGMDCSSFVQRVYKVFGIDLPRTAREQFRTGYAVTKSELRLGDLVFFKRPKSREPTHVGIYLGDLKYIHTSLTKQQVVIDKLAGRYADLHFAGARRVEEAVPGLEEAKAEGKEPGNPG